MGYQAPQTSSVAAALARLETEEPEFILLGFELDDADGLGALSQIREIDAEVPIIMLASDLWDTRVAEAMRRGAVAYLPKPFGPDDLRELLGRR
jgi:DNA-binding NtrC family response regulator